MEATAVREIVSLTEIQRLEEAPDYIVGFFNLRGRIVLVMDLDVRFGHPPQFYSLDDSIVVLEKGGEMAAVLIQQPQIVEIDGQDLEMESAYCRNSLAEPSSLLVDGLVKWGQQVSMRLNFENLVDFAKDPVRLAVEADSTASQSKLSSSFDSTASPATKELLHERAQRLAQVLAEETSEGSIAFAVVGLGGEFFGIELQTVREFCNVRNITPIPGCPPHIAGQMSLRGDFITVVDISSFVGLPTVPVGEDRKLVVMLDSRFEAAVLVDELFDVYHQPLEDSDLISGPPNRDIRTFGRGHVRGTATHGSRTLTLLDLPTLLAHESLQVNETPL